VPEPAPAEPSVIAVRYGRMDSTRSHQFYRYAAYGEDDGDIQLSYYFWVIELGGSTIVVDSGFHPDALADRPGRELLVSVPEALDAVGVDPSSVETVIVTHFHFDHIGNLAAFPEARFLVQRKEMEFWTGPHRARRAAAASVEASEIEFLAEADRAGRVQLVDGAHQVAPGIGLELVGGHCPGQQVVTVGEAAPLVLCSDSLHFREEMDRYMPFNVFFDLEDMYLTFDRFHAWEQAGGTIVPGHDPSVMSDFPAVPGATDLAVRLR
jgi:glyoxylase-like metal-dependent hydrolase (beta-lactamase superfamily II)